MLALRRRAGDRVAGQSWGDPAQRSRPARRNRGPGLALLACMAGRHARRLMARMGRAVVGGRAGMSVTHEIARLAESCGVALHYSSFWGEDKHVGEATLRRALDTMRVSGEPAHTGFPS